MSNAHPRYQRHVTLPELGEQGQHKLLRGSVLVIGAGGLGSPAAIYLAAAGVGRIGLADFDTVDISNLHRQILYGTGDVGRPKLEAASDRLRDLNPEVKVEAHQARLTSGNALELLAKYDVILDGTDNFPTRYLVNDACTILGKPNVYGSIFRFEGQVSVFDPRVGPCYRCLYPDPPPPNLVPSCAEAGVMGVLPGVVGTIQATEAIKLLAGIGKPLIGRLLMFDALEMSFRELKLRRRCDEHAAVTELIDYEGFCNVTNEYEITPTELSEMLSRGEEVVMIDVREVPEWNAGHLEGAQLIPLSQFGRRYEEVPRDRDVVLYCKVGGRSAQAQHFLQQSGYTRVKNLVGGLLRWARDVDPSMRVA